ncbi:type I glyceraldehyde-3-phosphate dehydrogenase [Tissierella praeacuta]|uniref:type I glyceraldehyde-3-phosphate dehydrogenase n=1 Tax=Tissierella praeacuta TaxID=43131 RepID=UPI000E007604|nr:type I glyceraldehyde-3-phosphate dehydrogenase [Tissierella praeacuta]MBU5256661.1 type I glyceraldehyde-3-phosphate dehydrogenase [Tissierella praeacuta]TCU75723.1 glyceraldehyde-3-phosphate dehydrogenase (NAD+) [Tissierella praeacuta]SUP00319.1 Glyceraldehyde-3-phosphate dehydrogenase 1 [Tissierella praeacuta]
MAMKVGLSGFGRIGRDVLRAYAENGVDEFEIVALNASGNLEDLAHLFKYDTMYGKFNGTIEVAEDGFIINGKKIKVVAHRDPVEIPWKELGVELVIDSTGAFRDRAGLSKHIEAGAKKVIITAPAKDEDITIVLGVNEDKYDPANHHIISNASCTTNCLAPVAKVILDKFGIKKGLMTTIHAYTNDQQILDKRHKDLRRARTAAQNIVPTTTGAAKAVALVLPELKGKLNGFSVRVPVPTVSMVDVVFEVEKPATSEEINQALKEASQGELKGILGYSEEPLVSSDYIADPRSSIVDGLSTMAIDNMVKVVSWYDNEWGYSERVIDLAKLVANK